jgi:hypothetical protein
MTLEYIYIYIYSAEHAINGPLSRMIRFVSPDQDEDRFSARLNGLMTSVFQALHDAIKIKGEELVPLHLHDLVNVCGPEGFLPTKASRDSAGSFLIPLFLLFEEYR